MAFSTQRGRPRKSTSGVDLGTPELIYKRAHALTAEAIDLCLERGIITQAQHWCAIHLRWLYTLRYGAPGVRAVDPTHLRGIEIKQDDPQWREEREREYQDAIALLQAQRCLDIALSICIYNERPSYLNATMRQRAAQEPYRASKALRERNALTRALDLLGKHWRRTAKDAKNS